jgi:hypothetical protein
VACRPKAPNFASGEAEASIEQVHQGVLITSDEERSRKEAYLRSPLMISRVGVCCVTTIDVSLNA